MCMDDVWEKWMDAWLNKKPFKADRVAVSYMLAGEVGAGASNIDPYATSATSDNQWVSEGPHLMLLVPDAAQLEGVSTDPKNGGAYVMWKGTPYAHVMVNAVRDGNGDCKPDQPVGNCERVQTAVAAKQLAQNPSSDEGDRREYGVRQVGKAKEAGSNEARRSSF